MAELAGLDAAVPWRSYIGGPEPRALGRQRLFYMMARQVLDEAQWRRVLAAMREAGARFDYDDPAPASAPASGDPAPPEAAEEHKFGMLLVSGGGAFHEMEQLREFAHFVYEAGVSGLVRRAYYDSGIDLCRFTLVDGPEAKRRAIASSMPRARPSPASNSAVASTRAASRRSRMAEPGGPRQRRAPGPARTRPDDRDRSRARRIDARRPAL